MKNKSNFLLSATLIAGVCFNYLFWDERLALNLLIYSLLIIAITLINKDIIKSKKMIAYAASHLFAAILVVINNSDLTLATYYISFILFIGFAHYQQIRSVFVAAMAFLIQMIATPLSLIKNFSQIKIGNYNTKPIIKLLKYIILPFFMVMVFTMIYSGANEIFGNAIESVFTGISNVVYDVLHFFFGELNLQRIFFFCFGLIISGGLIITFFDRHLETAELKCKEQLLRIRKNIKQKIWFQTAEIFSGDLLIKKLALKTEYIIAIIAFVSLNLLLLFLNGIDIWWLWLGKGSSLAETNYSAELHDGTNALIFSIILAMAVIVYFFRGNLNFYSKNKTLKTLAIIWMIQNFVLIISVLIRDTHYIHVYGLTYKRIGVLVFIILCIVGLATVYIKIVKQKTLFYLLKINGSIWYALLLAFTIINWDIVIAKYNLAQSDKISLDANYLLSLSDKTLPVIDKNKAKLHFNEGNNSYTRTYVSPETPEYYQRQLNQRINFFKERNEKVSWLSWNFPDWNTAKYFGFKN